MTNSNNINAMYVATSGTFDTNNQISCVTTTGNSISCTPWTFWQDYYYPQVIRESYPVYIHERAVDKGKQAFEIVKMLQDKKLVRFEKVADFIDAMDALIKIL